MSFYEALTVALSFGALLAVASSVWMLRRQLEIMSHQTIRLGQTLLMSSESSLDVLFMLATQAYLDHPELRPIFNEDEGSGTEPLADEATVHRASALAETLADAMERALKFEEFGVPGNAAAGLYAWIEHSFQCSAFFRRWLDQRRAWYSPSLLAILGKIEVELQASTPPNATRRAAGVSGLESPR